MMLKPFACIDCYTIVSAAFSRRNYFLNQLETISSVHLPDLQPGEYTFRRTY